MFNLLPAFRRSKPQNSVPKAVFTACDKNVLIDLSQVVKAYETPAGPFIALRGVDIKVEAGEFVAVIGKSGSGKSTLINMVTGIDRPTQGKVVVAGSGIHNYTEAQMARWRGRNLGVIFQFFQLLPTLSLIENVMLPMELVNYCTPQERQERGEYLLELVGLSEQIHKLPAMVSGGQQQRAAIARSLANDPSILVADEPTGNLDAKTADTIFRLFESFVAQGRTILMVTHDRDLASRVSRVIYIADGEVTGQQVSAALPSLSKDDLVDVYTNLEPIKYDAGDVIVAQGDVAKHMYIIARGELEVVLNHNTPQEIVVNTLRKGQYFGEVGIMRQSKRTATVRVGQDTDAVVMQLDRQTFINLVDRSDLTKDHILELMRERSEQMSMGALGFDLAHTNGMTTQFKTLSFEPGSTIIEAGQSADKFFIVVQGEVEVINTQQDGAEITIAQLGYGQYFGEIGLLRGGRRTATVRATAHGAEVSYINQEEFRELMTQPGVKKDDLVTLLQQRAVGLSMGLLGLEPSFIQRIASDLEKVVYQPGETIVQQGDIADRFYIIVQGTVDVIYRQPDGTEDVISHLHTGQYFGEAALQRKQGKRSATIKAGPAHVELLVMEQAKFRMLMQAHMSH